MELEWIYYPLSVVQKEIKTMFWGHQEIMRSFYQIASLFKFVLVIFIHRTVFKLLFFP